MNDQPAQNNSYVSDYQPQDDPFAMPAMPAMPATPAVSADPVNQTDDLLGIDEPLAPAASTPEPMPAPVASPSSAPATDSLTSSEKLEDQNIFYLLGVKEDEATADQREQFLDELQQVIWEDFLDNDVNLLLTKDEQTQLQALTAKVQGKPLEEQEEVVVFLEKLIPDLEEIMLEKALELKADMFRERIAGLKEYYADKPELEKVNTAEELLNQEKWFSAAQTLNALQ